MTSEYLEERAQGGSRRKFEYALDPVKDTEPDQKDELQPLNHHLCPDLIF